MNIEQSLNKLFALHNFGVKLGLDNTIRFLDHIGNPQQKLRAFHIAGSNGKGSTASFVASILQELGYKTGLYTSPHFVKFNERILIDSVQITDEYISSFVNENEKYIDDNELTFFEVTTAIAFKYFAEQEVDYCVIETGLGGRLDATNVLNPLAVIITSISLEHTNILGSTIEQIASEKAAIIKSGSKVFAGLLDDAANKVIIEKCEMEKTDCFYLKDHLNIAEEKLNLHSFTFNKDELQIPLKGKYQFYNASLAALAISESLQINDFKPLVNGIKNVIRNTGIQGRYEYFNLNPTIILDSAHNTDGVKNFLEEFKSESNNYSKRTLLFGAMRDKSIEEMLIQLNKYFDEIVITNINYERAARIEEIGNVCKRLRINVTNEQSPAEYVRKFLLKNSKECLVALGSMFLLGEIKSKMLINVT